MCSVVGQGVLGVVVGDWVFLCGVCTEITAHSTCYDALVHS